MRAPLASRLALALGIAFSLSFAPAGAKEEKNELPKVRKPAEFDYLDTDDEAEAQSLLEKLVAKYPGDKGALRLREVLSKRRPYPARVPDRFTFAHTGPDGKSREITWVVPHHLNRKKPTGVVVFLHGAVRQPAPGGGANEAGMFAPAFEDLGLIVVGPSTYEGVEWGSPACRDLVEHALRVVKQTFNVDENRVYVAGDSDGGRGTYAMVETEATFFAAAVPVIGAPGGVTRFSNLVNLPFFAINGDKDTIFTIDHVREAVKGMKASGIDLLYKEVAGGGHDPRYFLKFQDEVRTFLSAHPRVPYPDAVHWQLDPSRETTFPADTFRWVRIDEAGEGQTTGTFDDAAGSLVRTDLPRLEARRSGNRIDVTTRGVKRFTILVSPDMLDLTKPIEVVTNGKPSFSDVVVPDTKVLLEEARRFGDRCLLFVQRIAVEP